MFNFVWQGKNVNLKKFCFRSTLFFFLISSSVFAFVFKCRKGVMAGRVKEDEKNERIIRGLLKQPENRRCINCNSLVCFSLLFIDFYCLCFDSMIVVRGACFERWIVVLLYANCSSSTSGFGIYFLIHLLL